MNTRHLLMASLVGGLVSTVLVNTPFVNLLNILLCAGFWIGPIVAVWLYRRQNGTLTMREGLITGLLAGGWHGLFGLLLSPLGLAGAGGLLSTAQQILPVQALPDVESSLTGLGGLLFNLFGIGVDLIFGFLGGLVGGSVFKSSPVTA